MTFRIRSDHGTREGHTASVAIEDDAVRPAGVRCVRRSPDTAVFYGRGRAMTGETWTPPGSLLEDHAAMRRANAQQRLPAHAHA